MNNLKKNGKVVSSLMTSIENNVKSEIDYLNGYFIHLGKQLSIATPVNHRIYFMVKEIEDGKRSMMIENLIDKHLLKPKKYEKQTSGKVVEVKNDN
jgi:hypothetical protein